MSRTDPRPAGRGCPDAAARAAASPAARRPNRLGLAIAAMLLTQLVGGGLSAVVKILSADFHILQLQFFRNAFALIPLAIPLWRAGLGPALRTRRPGGHLLRAIFGTLGMYCRFVSYALLSLADAIALSFLAPLFLTALAVPILGERVGLHRWLAVLAGFGGMLIMVRPWGGGGGSLALAGVAAALGSALFVALAMTVVRQLTRTETTLTVVIWFTLIGAVMTGVAMPWVWTTPDPGQLGLLVLLGILGGVLQLLLTTAFRWAPASLISPFGYSAVVFAAGFDVLLWGAIPSLATCLGVAVITAAGLYVWARERRAEKAG